MATVVNAAAPSSGVESVSRLRLRTHSRKSAQSSGVVSLSGQVARSSPFSSPATLGRPGPPPEDCGKNSAHRLVTLGELERRQLATNDFLDRELADHRGGDEELAC